MKKIIFILVLSSLRAYADTTILDNSTDIIDTWIQNSPADNNYGDNTFHLIYDGSGADYRYLVCFQNLNDSIGTDQTIDSAKFYFLLQAGTSPGDSCPILSYLMWNPYWWESDTGSGEGGATWNDWRSPDSEWTTAGAECAYDAGNFNSYDDAGCAADSADRQSTYLDSILIPENSSTFDTFAVDITAAIDSAYQHDVNPSVLLKVSTDWDHGVYLYSREATGYEPWIVVYHHSSAGGGSKIWPIIK